MILPVQLLSRLDKNGCLFDTNGGYTLLPQRSPIGLPTRTSIRRANSGGDYVTAAKLPANRLVAPAAVSATSARVILIALFSRLFLRLCAPAGAIASVFSQHFHPSGEVVDGRCW